MRPKWFGLTEADLAAVPPALRDAREAYFRSYCAQRGWPQEPALLNIQQLAEIINSDEWPRAATPKAPEICGACGGVFACVCNGER